MILVPLPDRGATWRRTPLLWALVAVNALVLAFMMIHRDGDELTLAGALHPEAPTAWTFFSHMFLHSSIGHLVGNLLFLWGVGQLIHLRLGAWGFLGAYAVAGLAASLAFLLFGPNLPVVGASGAISGLMGLYAVLWPRRRMRIFYWIGKAGVFRPRAYWALGVWIAFQVWFATLDHPGDAVAYSAHIGGFAAGAAMGVLLRLAMRPGRGRAWVLEDPDADQETMAGHRARSVMHNLKQGDAEPMGRAWDGWETGPAHNGFKDAELLHVFGQFQRRGDAPRAAQAADWHRFLFGSPFSRPAFMPAPASRS